MAALPNFPEAVKIADGSFVSIGHEVVNLSATSAVVVRAVQHSDGSVGLVLREPNGRGGFRPGQWEADPMKCRKAEAVPR